MEEESSPSSSPRSDPSTDLPQELGDYIKESIDYTLGLSISTKTLQLKLQASEQSRRTLQHQYFALHTKLKEKDQSKERARAEASMNAQALKKFVEENRELVQQCTELVNERVRWEQECLLYEHDRDALIEFANEADARAKEADEQWGDVAEELKACKKECETRVVNEKRLTEELCLLREKINVLENLRLQEFDDNQLHCSPSVSPTTEKQKETTSPVSGALEDELLQSIIACIYNKDGLLPNAHSFLEANCGIEPCQNLLKMWDRLRPSTRSALALVSELKILQDDKEHLRINLARAEEEVKVLFEENNIRDGENKRLLRLYNRERHHHGSGDKHTNSSSTKGSKRKSTPKNCSPVDAMMDFDSPDASRPPLSPLNHNSPSSRMHKK